MPILGTLARLYKDRSCLTANLEVDDRGCLLALYVAELLADWDADAEVSDLLIARWDRTVLRRLSPQARAQKGKGLRS